MSMIEQLRPGMNTPRVEVVKAKEEQETKKMALEEVQSKSIFDTFKAGTTSNPAKMDQTEAAKESAKTQYTLADMKLFHEESNFQSLISSGKLMA